MCASRDPAAVRANGFAGVAPERSNEIGVAISEADRKQYGLGPDVKGVLITHVDPDSEAYELGIRAGNVIVAILGVPVTTPDEVRRAIKQVQEQGRPYLAGLIQSQTGVRWVSFSIAAR